VHRKSSASSDPSPAGSIRDAVFVVRDIETLRLVSDPLRLRLLELLREEPRTAKDLAAALRVPRTKLYYHLKLLEDRGLITVADTRLVSGIVEKRYRASAYRLTVDKALIGPTAEGGDALDTYVSVVLNQVRSEINRSVDAGLIDLERTQDDAMLPRRLLLGRKWLRLSPERVAELSRRYEELLDAFAEPTPDTEEEDGQLYEWLIAFFPVLPPEPDAAANTDDAANTGDA
jgi:DNA-binding transcriptional ArsR family regulator